MAKYKVTKKIDANGTLEDLLIDYETGIDNKPTIPTVTSNVTSGSTEALTSGGAYSNTSRVTLNGTSVRNASFYAPTTAGTSGYFLKSNGSGAPTWQEISVNDFTSTQVILEEVD